MPRSPPAVVPAADRTFSPRELADAVGVSESSVKRWVDAGELDAVRTAGGHRRISLSVAVRFIRQRRLILLNPGVLGLADLSRVPVALASAPVTAELLADLLQSEHPEFAGGMVVAAYLRGEPLAPLFDGPVRQAMHHVGRLWESGRRGIVVEHRATDILVRAIHEVRAAIPPAGPSAPVAVGAATASDPYVIPSLMAATVLADLGFTVENLGPDTPSDVLAAAARERRAMLVWMSASVGEAETVRDAVGDLADRLQRTEADIVVGGRATSGLRRHDWARLSHTANMQGLVEVARNVLARCPETLVR